MDANSNGRRQGARDALVAAGLQLFAGNADAVSVDDIIGAAKVSKQTFYNHFTDKAALLAAIRASVRAMYRQFVDRANVSQTDAARRLARGLCAYAFLAMQDRVSGRFVARTLLDDLGTASELNCGVTDEVALGLAQGRLSGLTLASGVCFTLGITQALVAFVLTADDTASAIATAQHFTLLLLRAFGLGQAEAEAIAGETADQIMRPRECQSAADAVQAARCTP